MKFILVALLAVSSLNGLSQRHFHGSICCCGVDTIPKKKQPDFIVGPPEWGMGYADSTGKIVGVFWDKRGWQIHDTMGLINALKWKLERSQDKEWQYQELFSAAHDFITHIPEDFANKNQFDLYVYYGKIYLQVWKKYFSP